MLAGYLNAAFRSPRLACSMLGMSKPVLSFHLADANRVFSATMSGSRFRTTSGSPRERP